MLVACAPQPEADWTPVMGAEVQFRPIDRGMLRRARRAAVAAVGGGAATESDADVDEQLAELGDALSYALISEGIVDWRGVAVEVAEDGNTSTAPLDCTPDAIRLVLSDPLTFEAFDQAYVVPFVTRERERAAPGNGSAASPSGTGEAAMPASAIASSRAQRRKATGAKNAPTSPRKRGQRPKRASGAS